MDQYPVSENLLSNNETILIKKNVLTFTAIC